MAKKQIKASNLKLKTQTPTNPQFLALRNELIEAKKQVFIKAFRLAGGNVSEVSRGLGVSRGMTMTYLKSLFGRNYKQGIIEYLEGQKPALSNYTIKRQPNNSVYAESIL